MYQKDEAGNLYRVAERWVNAWAGGGPYIAGYCIHELRQYENGTVVVKAGEPKYVNQNPEIAFAHSVYMRAAKELVSGARTDED